MGAVENKIARLDASFLYKQSDRFYKVSLLALLGNRATDGHKGSQESYISNNSNFYDDFLQ